MKSHAILLCPARNVNHPFVRRPHAGCTVPQDDLRDHIHITRITVLSTVYCYNFIFSYC